jgi:DNA-binding transcriptional ArsR family regulator
LAKPSGKQLSNIVQAYGHPIRARALLIFGTRVASPKEIAEEMGEPIGKVSYHIRELRDWGLIELVETDARHGGVQHFYRATRLASMDKDGMASQDAVERAASSALAINMMVADLATAVAGGTLDSRPERVLARRRALVDQRGFKEMSDLYTETLYQAFKIQREARARLRESPDEDGIVVALQGLLFEMPSTEPVPLDSPLGWMDAEEPVLQSRGGRKKPRGDDGGPDG